MLKKYKNIYFSITSYIAAAIWFIAWIQIGNMLLGTALSAQVGKIMNVVVLGVFFIIIFVGIYFASKSNKAKESSWGGNFLMAIGIIAFLIYLFLMSGFMGF